LGNLIGRTQLAQWHASITRSHVKNDSEKQNFHSMDLKYGTKQPNFENLASSFKFDFMPVHGAKFDFMELFLTCGTCGAWCFNPSRRR
jgi:hypothetical protein